MNHTNRPLFVCVVDTDGTVPYLIIGADNHLLRKKLGSLWGDVTPMFTSEQELRVEGTVGGFDIFCVLLGHLKNGETNDN